MNMNQQEKIGELPIFLSEFTVEAQKKIKRFLEIKSSKKLNLDTFPLFVLPKPEK